MNFLTLSLVINFIALTKTVSQGNDVFNFETHLNGHQGYFKQKFSLYPVNNPLGVKIIAKHAIEFVMLPKEPVIKFFAVEARPHLFIERDADGFNIWGPLYSLAHEAAKWINYSINGISIVNEDRHAAFAIFKPDFVVALVWPELEYVRLTFFEDDPFGVRAFGVDSIGWITKAIGVVETDHILYYSRHQNPSLFSFLDVFSLSLWLVLFTLATSVFIVTWNDKIATFGYWLFLMINSILSFSTNILKFRDKLLSIQIHLFLLWMTFGFLLQSLFGGDMFAQLTLEPKPIVIDSLDDLKNDESLRIKTIDFDMFNDSSETRKSLFDTLPDNYKTLSERADFFTFEELSSMKICMENTFGEDNDNLKYGTCAMGPKSYQDFVKNSFDGGRFRDILHVSKEGGEAQMHTFPRELTADEKESFAMDYV